MKTMAEVVESLAKRNYEAEWYKGWDTCPESARPGWIESAQDTIAFLTAAGFAPVKAAQAELLSQLLKHMEAWAGDKEIGFMEGALDAARAADVEGQG